MTTETMKYNRYKKHYSDCDTVRGSYDKETKTIAVIIPEGRMKKSGVRGQHFHGYELYCIDNKNNRKVYITYSAVSLENAQKQHKKWCKECDYEYTDEVKHIYL